MNEDRIVTLLTEIRDTQREALAQQRAQLEIAQAQLKRTDTQIEESLTLQREAVSRQRTITRIAAPGLIACIVAIAYLVLRYF
jgi:hypothetical protein